MKTGCLTILFIGLCSALFVSLSWGQTCERWTKGVPIGQLDISILPEASGVAASHRFPNRLYHINDSNNDSFFFITDFQGDRLQSIRIERVDNLEHGPHPTPKNTDFEDISVGPCFAEESCLFIADIGDNFGPADSPTRKTIEILIIRERAFFPSSVAADQEIVLVYPDEPHNAEGFAVHPNGDLFILTKEIDYFTWTAFPAQLYSLPRHEWERTHQSVHQLVKVGEFNLPNLAPSHSSLWGQVVTGFDIHPSGRNLLVLTYEFAFEFFGDPSRNVFTKESNLQDGRDYRVIPLHTLPQQEGITYLPGGESFVYHTEYSKPFFRLIRGFGFAGKPVDIIRVDCLQ
jgi:hypothetical protein